MFRGEFPQIRGQGSAVRFSRTAVLMGAAVEKVEKISSAVRKWYLKNSAVNFGEMFQIRGEILKVTGAQGQDVFKHYLSPCQRFFYHILPRKLETSLF